jgi:hypothetical protein
VDDEFLDPFVRHAILYTMSYKYSESYLESV